LSHQVLSVGERESLLKLALQGGHQVDTSAVGWHDPA
jgi:hypothetical protein